MSDGWLPVFCCSVICWSSKCLCLDYHWSYFAHDAIAPDSAVHGSVGDGLIVSLYRLILAGLCTVASSVIVGGLILLGVLVMVYLTHLLFVHCAVCFIFTDAAIFNVECLIDSVFSI